MKEKRKQVSSSKKLGILFLVIVLIFAAINLFWLFTVKLPYNGYCKSLNAVDSDGTVLTETVIGEYLYSVRVPEYMNFNRSHLTIENNDGAWVNVDGATGAVIDSSGLTISLNVLPGKFWEDTLYRLWFVDDTNDLDAMIYIDENCNYSPLHEVSDEVRKNTEKLIKDNIEEIERLMSLAKDMWDI